MTSSPSHLKTLVSDHPSPPVYDGRWWLLKLRMSVASGVDCYRDPRSRPPQSTAHIRCLRAVQLLEPVLDNVLARRGHQVLCLALFS